MFQVRTQSGSELLWGQLHAAQHPFDDVAVVAKQTSRGAGVVAVIGPDLSVGEVPIANGTAIVLVGEKPVNLLLAHASALAALGVNYLCPRRRIGSDFGVLGRSSATTFRTLAERSSPLAGFRRIAVFLAARLYLRALAVCSPFSAGLLQIVEAALPVRFKVSGPLFRGAISFSHLAYATPNSPGLNRAVVSKEILL